MTSAPLTATPLLLGLDSEALLEAHRELLLSLIGTGINYARFSNPSQEGHELESWAPAGVLIDVQQWLSWPAARGPGVQPRASMEQRVVVPLNAVTGDIERLLEIDDHRAEIQKLCLGPGG